MECNERKVTRRGVEGEAKCPETASQINDVVEAELLLSRRCSSLRDRKSKLARNENLLKCNSEFHLSAQSAAEEFLKNGKKDKKSRDRLKGARITEPLENRPLLHSNCSTTIRLYSRNKIDEHQRGFVTEIVPLASVCRSTMLAIWRLPVSTVVRRQTCNPQHIKASKRSRV